MAALIQATLATTIPSTSLALQGEGDSGTAQKKNRYVCVVCWCGHDLDVGVAGECTWVGLAYG